MLVLTRRLGEAITIGDNIRIVVVDISGNQVKIGIDAPKDVEIYREELYTRIKGVSFGKISKGDKQGDPNTK